MTALILTIAIIAVLCYLVSWYVSFWAGVFLFAWILFSIGWFFRTMATTGKTGKETMFDRIAMAPMIPIAIIFGQLNHHLQTRLGLP